MGRNSTRKLVLITGAAGMIGRDMQVLLRDRFRLRVMYRNRVLPTEHGQQVVIGDTRLGDIRGPWQVERRE